MLDESDAVAAAPEHHKVLFEDNQVRVLETVIQPGEETKVHTHVWGGSLYIVSWSDCVRYDDKGTVMFDSRSVPAPEPGAVIAAPPLPPHSLRNVGTSTIHVILTEIKSPKR